ncbi:MAG: hypothetical protein K0Q87_3461 [Neobacillus sp.]|jgi:hypothetical protein|nr:hypothetical protein [Neobacillus sp.]
MSGLGNACSILTKKRPEKMWKNVEKGGFTKMQFVTII